jgi:fructokinase
VPAAEVLVVGEALVDVVEDVAGRRTERPGGSPANVAVGLHRLGRAVTLLTALGNDRYGDLLRSHLDGISLVTAELPATGTALARLDAAGSATYAFDISWDLAGLEPEPARWVHVGSLAAVLPPGADAVLALAQRSVAAGSTVSFDPNCRPDVADRDVDRVEALAALSGVIKLSDEDLAWLYPGEPFEDVARRWLAGRTELVVLTRGSAGASGVTAEGTWEVPAAPGGAVVDTVGAGDAFMAGLVDALVEQWDVPAALERAALVARRTCERPGADPPTATELTGR